MTLKFNPFTHKLDIVDVTGGPGGTISSITGDTGTAVFGDGSGNVNLFGGSNIIVNGNPGTNTLTASVTGTTNHAVQVGNSGGSLTSIPVGTNGQVLIGATGADPAFANLTSTGGTIAFTTGPNTLNLEVISAVVTWTNVTGTSATMAKSNGYQSNNAGLVTLTMPSVASSTFGDTIKVGGFGSGGWLIQCVATQIIHFGASATTAAGSLSSNNRYDQVELVCSSTTNEWFVRYAVGNLTVA